MKTVFLALLVVVVVAWAKRSEGSGQSYVGPCDTVEILKEFAAAFNRQDFASMAKMYAPGAKRMDNNVQASQAGHVWNSMQWKCVVATGVVLWQPDYIKEEEHYFDQTTSTSDETSWRSRYIKAHPPKPAPSARMHSSVYWHGEELDMESHYTFNQHCLITEERHSFDQESDFYIAFQDHTEQCFEVNQ